jgi:hypothetical protein
MDFAKIFGNAKDIVSLKVDIMKLIAGKKNLLQEVVLITFLSSFAAALGRYLFPVSVGDLVLYRPEPLDVVWQTIGGVVLSLIILYVMGAISEHVFKTKVKMEAFVWVMGYASILGFFQIIPALGIIVGIWSLVVLWKFMSEIGGMKPMPFVGFLLLTGLTVYIIPGIFSFLGLGAFMAMGY